MFHECNHLGALWLPLSFCAATGISRHSLRPFARLFAHKNPLLWRFPLAAAGIRHVSNSKHPASACHCKHPDRDGNRCSSTVYPPWHGRRSTVRASKANQRSRGSAIKPERHATPPPRPQDRCMTECQPKDIQAALRGETQNKGGAPATPDGQAPKSAPDTAIHNGFRRCVGSPLVEVKVEVEVSGGNAGANRRRGQSRTNETARLPGMHRTPTAVWCLEVPSPQTAFADGRYFPPLSDG